MSVDTSSKPPDPPPPPPPPDRVEEPVGGGAWDATPTDTVPDPVDGAGQSGTEVDAATPQADLSPPPYKVEEPVGADTWDETQEASDSAPTMADEETDQTSPEQADAEDTSPHERDDPDAQELQDDQDRRDTLTDGASAQDGLAEPEGVNSPAGVTESTVSPAQDEAAQPECDGDGVDLKRDARTLPDGMYAGDTQRDLAGLMDNENLREQLEAAWDDSHVDDYALRHEEGGWIIENPDTGDVRVERFPPGERAGLSLTEPDLSNSEKLVGMFHTHPNPRIDERGDSWKPGPSDTDLDVATRLGIPGVIQNADGYVYY